MNTPIFRRLCRSRGVSIVTAVFLLVVLSGIGVAIVSLSTTQQQAAVVDLLGTRAYEAARTGLEYGMYRLRRDGVACPSGTFTGPGSLSAMTITVTCAQSSNLMADNVTTLTQTRITSTACNQPANGACPNGAPGPDYVQRVMQVVF
jgi:MSHA biogenesis protein MshP